MKKTLFVLLVTVLLILSSCGSKNNSENKNSSKKNKSSVVVSSAMAEVVESSEPEIVSTTYLEVSSAPVSSKATPSKALEKSMAPITASSAAPVVFSSIAPPASSDPYIPTDRSEKYYSDLSSAQQAAYKIERDTIDEKFVSDLKKLLVKIESAEQKAGAGTIYVAQILGLEEDITQLETKRRNAVAEATLATGGQMNTNAITIDNQYKVLIAQKQKELTQLKNSQPTGTNSLVQSYQKLAITLLDIYNLDVLKLNDKYGIVG